MGLVCGGCAPGAAITGLANVTKAGDGGWGQIQKVIFQRIYSSGSTRNSFTIATTNPNALASWTALESAVDGTKIQVSPYIQNVVFTPGGPLEEGGANETLGGIPIVVGREATRATSVIRNAPTGVIEDLKKYQCEEMGIYLINECGNIIGIADDPDTPTIFYPIPVFAFFIGDRTPGGFQLTDTNQFNWSFEPNWSDRAYLVDTLFDARIALVNT